MPKITTERTQMLQVRVEADLNKAVQNLATGNGMTKSEMARALIRRGIRAVAEDDGTASKVGPPVELDRDTVAARAVFLMEMLDGLANGIGAADPEGAVLLLRGVSHATGASVADWEQRAGAGGGYDFTAETTNDDDPTGD